MSFIRCDIVHQVNTNGVISFSGGVSTYTPEAFPVSDNPLIAVFWGDVDTIDAGSITYRCVRECVRRHMTR